MRPLAARAALLTLVLVLAGCAGSDDNASDGTKTSPAATAPGPESATAARRDDRTVIDVRTPEEYEAGHVEGAQLTDIQAADFDSKINALDPDGAYVVYCRTGNRSAAATKRMKAAGLDVVDGGSLDDMLASGWTPSS